MSNVFKSGALLAGLVLVMGLAATSVLRADTTPPPTTPPSTPAPAAAPKPPHHSGTVTAVDTTANTITIKPRKGADQTYKTTADTKIKVKGQKVAVLADIQVGWDARIVTTEDGATATEIHAGPHVDKPKTAASDTAPATTGAPK